MTARGTKAAKAVNLYGCEMTARGTKAAKAVNLYVNFGWWLCAIGLVVVPLGLVVVLGALAQPDRPAPDMPVLARIQVDEAALTPPAPGQVAEPSTLVGGQGWSGDRES
jgi:hypothetical protein